ncbi:MAG: hypothetical protein NT159_03890 [Proteobacteria bacterium]|nr:hypothetical protein [Pseudomonadota bacterium]
MLHTSTFRLSRFWNATALATAMLVVPVVASGQALFAPDTSFLKEQPYRKIKQRVDLTGVASQADLDVIKDGINPIVLFFAHLNLKDIPPERMFHIATHAGAQRLRLPPLELVGGGRYYPEKMYDWKVTGDSTITVTASFQDPIKKAASPYTDTFVFVKGDGKWQFDRHP